MYLIEWTLLTTTMIKLAYTCIAQKDHFSFQVSFFVKIVQLFSYRTEQIWLSYGPPKNFCAPVSSFGRTFLQFRHNYLGKTPKIYIDLQLQFLT